MIAVADTSGLVALFNRADPEHARMVAAASKCGLLVLSALAITEVHQIATIRADRRTADFIVGVLAQRVVSGRMAIAETTPALLQAAIRVRQHYAALDLDLADAMAVAVAAESLTDAVLTLDRRDFRAIRPLTGEPAFRLLPDDA